MDIMNYNLIGWGISEFLQQNPIILFLIIIWSLYWKGMSLWKAAKLDSQKWFIALLILNTLGILEILYLYIFSKKSEKQPSQ